MKKLFALFLVPFILLPLGSCTTSEESFHYVSDYTGFSDIPEDYTAADAIADGCLVIDSTTKENEHGVTVTNDVKTSGYDHWTNFVTAADNGTDSFLRAVHFLDGVGYYYDLYYRDGKYTLYKMDEYGVSPAISFQYLRHLTGKLSGTAREGSVYVLTDSLELTYRDVHWKYLSSNSEAVTTIPFYWLTFMLYFD